MVFAFGVDTRLAASVRVICGGLLGGLFRGISTSFGLLGVSNCILSLYRPPPLLVGVVVKNKVDFL